MADRLGNVGWSEQDAAWERLQREAKAALLSDLPRAKRPVSEALDLAQRHFSTGDPRLAASLASQAWLLLETNPALAGALFQEALAHWAQAGAWLARQPPPERLAKSSAFHFRLESKHPGAYRERRHQDMRALLAHGRALTEGLRAGADNSAVATGRDSGPAGVQAFDSYRKVKTAVDLLPGGVPPAPSHARRP